MNLSETLSDVFPGFYNKNNRIKWNIINSNNWKYDPVTMEKPTRPVLIRYDPTATVFDATTVNQIMRRNRGRKFKHPITREVYDRENMFVSAAPPSIRRLLGMKEPKSVAKLFVLTERLANNRKNPLFTEIELHIKDILMSEAKKVGPARTAIGDTVASAIRRTSPYRDMDRDTILMDVVMGRLLPGELRAQVYNQAIERVLYRNLKAKEGDLIITDPKYSNHNRNGFNFKKDLRFVLNNYMGVRKTYPITGLNAELMTARSYNDAAKKIPRSVKMTKKQKEQLNDIIRRTFDL